MFGCCVAGRLLQTNLVQVDETHAYFELFNAGSINHVCVFLLGTIPFPDGFGATVHFFWPGKGFQLLGLLSNDKPSAIFRLRGSFSSSSASAAQDRFSIYSQGNETAAAAQDVTAILGVSIEPLAQIQYQIASSSSSSSSSSALVPSSKQTDLANQPVLLAERIVKHLINYISSFVGGGVGPEVMLPMSVIVKWYESFLSKVKAGGTGFLERDK